METKQVWNEVIKQKLKPGQSLEDLKYDYGDGIVMEPNITYEEVDVPPAIQGKPWVNMASIKPNDSKSKNQLALAALNQGANGIEFVLDPSDDLELIFKGIHTEYITVLVSGNHPDIDGIDYPNVSVVHEQDQCTVRSGKNRIEDLRKLNQNPKPKYINLWIGPNLLYETATCRAIKRMLQDADHQLIVRYEIEGNNELGDYNLIEKTYKVLSAVLGQSDIVITPYSGQEEDRLTLNIHHILELESGMKRVMDPTAGSYYIELLTKQILDKIENK